MYSEEYDDQEEKTNGSFLSNFYNNNKVLVWIFIGIIAFILILTLFTKNGSNSTPSDYNIIVNYNGSECPDDLYVKIGRSVSLRAAIKGMPNATFTWIVGDDKIATVDNGNIRGISYGRTTVKAIYVDSNNKDHPSKLINVIVGTGEQDIPLTDVKFKDGDLFMPLNSKYQIALELVPARGYVENEVFTSSNTSVVTVDDNGLVTSVGEGEATINVDINNGAFSKELKVYVNRDYTRSEIIVTPTRISFDGKLLKIKKGSTENLSYTTDPDNTDKSKLVWESSNENYVTVKNGKVTGVNEGRATITVKSVNGTNANIEVEVENDIIDVTNIELGITDITINQGQSQVITPVIIPDNASNKALGYNSTDNSIASVVPNSTGTNATITGVSPGNATIIVSSVGSSNIVEKRINVRVVGSGGSGGTPSGGGGGSSTSGQGFSISSSDANGGTFITKDYSGGKNNNNGAIAPVNVTVRKINSSVYKLVIKVSKCPNGTSCSLQHTYSTLDSTSFVISDVGEYTINVEEQDSSNNVIRSTNKYIWVRSNNNGGGNPSGAIYRLEPTILSKTVTDARANPYSLNTTVKFNIDSNVGFIKVCYYVDGPGKTCPDTNKRTFKTSNSIKFNKEGTWKIYIEEYYNGQLIPNNTEEMYIHIEGNGATNPSTNPPTESGTIVGQFWTCRLANITNASGCIFLPQYSTEKQMIDALDGGVDKDDSHWACVNLTSTTYSFYKCEKKLGS